MNTFWLKVAGIVVIVVVVIVVIGIFTGGDESKPRKTVYDQWEEDENELTAEPRFREPTTPQRPARPTTQSRTVEPSPAEPIEPPKPQFKKLSPEKQMEAERLWQWALEQRKMGRLPGMSYKKMVDTCREIIHRWPESEYAFYAKRALADLSERYKEMYNITEEETDLGNFK